MIDDPKNAVMAYYDINDVAIIEQYIPFEKFSIIAARSANGDFYCYDIADNIHENIILKTSTVHLFSKKYSKKRLNIHKKLLIHCNILVLCCRIFILRTTKL